MDANNILNTLNHVLDLGDKLDNAGGGVKRLTNGEHSTREVCKIELGQFLLYLANCSSYIDNEQAAVLNLVLGDEFTQIPDDKFKELSNTVSAPDPSNNATLAAFMQADLALSRQNEENSSSLTSILISIYKAFGQLLIVMNENTLAHSRYDRFISQMEDRAALVGYSADDDDSSLPKELEDDDFEIDDDVLTKYNGSASDVTIPSGLTRIGDDAFFENNTIESVIIPLGVKSIGDSAFWECENLTHVKIPEGVTSIEGNAFNGCKSLEVIELPSTVKSIGNDAFGNCSKLKRIRINTPAALDDVGDDAFYECDSLEAVVICGKRRNTSTISKLKVLFPQDVAVIWEGDPQENVILGQVIRDGQNTLFAFKPGIMISLPSDKYDLELVEEGLHEGDLKITPKQKREDGEETFEFLCSIDEPWGSGDDVFEKIEGWFDNLYFFIKEYSTTPRSHIMLQDLNFRLDLAISKDKSLEINLDSWISDESDYRTAIILLISIWQGVTISGSKATFDSISSDALVDEWIDAYKAACQKKKEKEEHEQNQRIEKGKKKVKKHVAKYNDMFSFSLPAGSELIWKDAEDGSKVGEIAVQVLVNDDESIEYDKLVVINDLTVRNKEGKDDDSKSAIELMIDAMQGCRYRMLCNGPDTALIVSDRAISFIGSPMKVVELDIIVNYAPGKLLRMLYAEQLEKIKSDKAEIFRLMLDVAKNIRYDGKPLMIPDLNCDELGQQMILDDFEAESLGGIGLKVVFNGKEVAHIGSSGSNEEDGIPFATPQVADQYHEHYTLVTSGSYTTHRDADFVGQPIRMLMEKCGNTSEEAYDLMGIPNDNYTLDVEARRLARVFRLDESLFDPYKDTEAMIRCGMFEDVKMLHALRSLAWIVFCKADREGKQPDAYSFEELERIGKAIEDDDYLHYSTESYCSGLCSHYDWRVFYVPDSYKGSNCERNTDLRLLCGKENRSGNTSFVVFGGLGSLSSMNRASDIISRNEETLESLESLRKDLTDLLPVMQTIYDGFMQDRDRSEKLEGPLSEALTAWCALAVAAKEAFYSEEANDSPEVDAGLREPLERPSDGQDKLSVNNISSSYKSKEAQRQSRPVPKGDILDLNGATIISAGQFNGNMTLRNIVIPEGVTEIGEYAFYSCMFLETVVFPKSLKKIGKMAFMSCRSLHLVEIPEGVEEICDHAFGATNNLKEVHLPNSLQRVHRYIFGLGGDSPYATAYMSGELASRLQAGSKDARFLSAINARRYVIDGIGYENMYDYGRQGSSSSGLSADVERKSIDEYRSEMEDACKDGKSLQDMIEAGRKAVNANEYGDRDAFEQAIKNLDKNAVITFAGKHFVLTGFGDYEKDVIAEIEKRGGIIHSSMVKMADYLIVCLESPGAAKVKKALEWRQKGASNLIVSDYQMWQAIFEQPSLPLNEENATESKLDDNSSPTKRKSQLDVKKASGSGKNAKDTVETKQTNLLSPSKLSIMIPEKEDQEEHDNKQNETHILTLNLSGRTVVEAEEFEFGKGLGSAEVLILPEGVKEIQGRGFANSYSLKKVVFPSTLRSIDHNVFNECVSLKEIEFKEGIERIGFWAFGRRNEITDIYLPDTIRELDRDAFSEGTSDRYSSHITLHISSKVAMNVNLVNAAGPGNGSPYLKVKAVYIDGIRYNQVEEYKAQKLQEERDRRTAEIERQRHDREEAERRADEAKKQEQRNRVKAEIQSLTDEMNSLRGLFAGIKRKKLQKQIDELNEQLHRI